MRVWWVSLGCVLPVLALAAPDPLPPALTALLATPGHHAALLAAAHAVDGPGVAACPDATYATTGQVGVLDPVQVDASGKITAGAWKEQVQETGCDTSRVLNAVSFVGPDGQVQTEPLLPGTTITDPQLQEDSVRYAAAGIGDMPAGCDQGGVVDTRFVGVDGAVAGVLPVPGTAPKPWTEVWTLQACAKRVQVSMHFIPDATGTQIRATPVTP